jgi:uncharacterized protein
MTISKDSISCPNCHQKNTWRADNKFRPFCSERCKLIDLGDWAAEKHRVAGEPADPNQISDEEKDKE